MQQKKIVLSIGLLVSNRKDTIRKCLDSLTPIRKAIPSELIIIDTGCDEEVRSILKEYADVLERFTWCNDFSKARNETLKYAHGEWYLYLDDDEWFADTKELIGFFQSGEYKNYGYASYVQRNYLDMQASQYTDAWVSRMTKLTHETHFESKIHEYIVPMKGNCKGLHSYVDHFGYVYETEEALWKHYERNALLLKEMIKEEPKNLRWRIQMAQEYRTVREWQKLYDLGEECLGMVKEKNEMYANIYLGAFYAAKIVAMREWGKNEEGLLFCEEASRDKRNTELFQAFAELRMAWFCYWLGRLDEAMKHVLEYFKWRDFFEKNEPLLFLQRSAPFVADSFDIVMQKEMYSIMMCSMLRKGDASYLGKYFSKLEWDGKHLYVFEDMVQTLIFAMNRWDGRSLMQDVEETDFLQGKASADNVSEEIYKTVLQTMYAHGALWEYFCQELCRAQEEGQNVHNVMELIRKALPQAIANKNSVGNAEIQNNATQSQEMKQLAEQIKVQLHLLIQNGMCEEAKSVIAQLKRMLPKDAELEEMERLLDVQGKQRVIRTKTE
uniref:glycosyltransferase n=1 Tax=Agathobacter sp. TaxID=2021311 RepID=UPI004057969D